MTMPSQHILVYWIFSVLNLLIKISFEQVCIKYCKKASQQQFNKFVFKQEQKEHTREGYSIILLQVPREGETIENVN